MSVTVPADEITPVWQSYIDLDNDVKPYLQIPPSTTNYDTTLQLLIDSECQWVQNYLGRPIAPTSFNRQFWGTWQTTLQLPYYPILSVESVVETWGLNGQHTLVYQTPTAQGGAGQQMYQVDWLRGYLIRTYQGMLARPFFGGVRNVQVQWTAGYNPLPADIKRATLLLVKERWNQEQQASRGPKPASSGMPMYEPQDGYMMSVQAEVKRYLEPYTQIGIG